MSLHVPSASHNLRYLAAKRIGSRNQQDDGVKSFWLINHPSTICRWIDRARQFIPASGRSAHLLSSPDRTMPVWALRRSRKCKVQQNHNALPCHSALGLLTTAAPDSRVRRRSNYPRTPVRLFASCSVLDMGHVNHKWIQRSTVNGNGYNTIHPSPFGSPRLFSGRAFDSPIFIPHALLLALVPRIHCYPCPAADSLKKGCASSTGIAISKKP